jgi:hypothetical protein
MGVVNPLLILIFWMNAALLMGGCAPKNKSLSDPLILVGKHPTALVKATPAPDPAPGEPHLEKDGTSRVILGLDRNGMKRKNRKQLETSLNACLGGKGSELFNIGEQMVELEPGQVSNSNDETRLKEEGRIRFLVPLIYKEHINKSILEIQSAMIEGGQAGRVNTSIDSLEDEGYLRATSLVANVVAWNCDDTKHTCNCEGPEKSKEMLKRCITILDPSSPTFLEIAQLMGSDQRCGHSDRFERRKALASFLSSFLFLVSN